MGYFEFLHGSRMICLPLNISEKLHWQHLFEKLEETETHGLHLCSYNTIPTYPHMPLQQGPILYIPLKATCCLFIAYYGFVLPAEKEL